MTRQHASELIALGLILLVALAWRLNNIGFGLPSMYDPDEPIFMIKALHLLADGTLNPGWFGHPGSTTIYLVALIDALNKAKPASSKGVYLRKVAVSSTMGLGVRVDLQTLAQQAAAS